MDGWKTWAFRFGCAAVTAGALLSRDACLGGARPPPPEPKGAESAVAPTTAAPTQTTATPTQNVAAPTQNVAAPAPSGTAAAPP